MVVSYHNVSYPTTQETERIERPTRSDFGRLTGIRYESTFGADSIHREPSTNYFRGFSEKLEGRKKMNPSSTENCPDSLFSQLSNTGALIASSTSRYQQESSPSSLPLQLCPFPIDQDQPNVVSLPILRSAAQRLAAATPGMSSYESGVAALPHDGLSQSFAPPSTSQLPPSSLVSASSSDPLSSTAATPDNAADGLSSKKQSSKMFRCTGFGDCSMTFTRSEHLARHVR